MPKFFVILIIAVLAVLVMLWLAPLKKREPGDIPNEFTGDRDVKIVYYVPCWKTNKEPQKEQSMFLKQRFPNAEIFVHYWGSNKEWYTAKANADVTLLRSLLRLSEQDLNLTVIAGHSLERVFFVSVGIKWTYIKRG